MLKEQSIRANQRQKGFTLLELMMVVGVIGILVSIAVPSYGDYVRRGRIADATAALSDTRVKLEQFFLDNRTYVGFATCPISSAFFQYSCSPLTNSAYRVTATGQGSMANFEYTLNQQNTKASTTSWGNSTTCWVRAKGGVC